MAGADGEPTTPSAQFEPLEAALEGFFDKPLEGFFDKPLDALHARLQRLVKRRFLIDWDILSPARRREVARQSDLNHDPANAFAQEFWLALAGRRLDYGNLWRETKIAPASDARALEDRDRRLRRFAREIESLSADEAEVATAWPSKQRAAMLRVVARWREHDRREGDPGGLSVAVAVSVVGRLAVEAPTPDPMPATPEPVAPAPETVAPIAAAPSSEAYTACVASLRALAAESPDYRSHTRKQLRGKFKGALGEKAWRDALREAFKDSEEWHKEGRRKL